MNEIYIRTREIYDIDLFFFRTVNFVINSLFFELYSFELRCLVVLMNCYLFFSHLSFQFTHLITSKLNFSLKSSVARKRQRKSCSALAPEGTSQTMRFQMLFQETSAFCYLAARRVDPNLAL